MLSLKDTINAVRQGVNELFRKNIPPGTSKPASVPIESHTRNVVTADKTEETLCMAAPIGPPPADSIQTHSKVQVDALPREKRDIVIGFDFGTAITKVVARDASAGISYAIPFKGLAPDSNDYLLPGLVGITFDRGYILSGLDKRHEVISNLKLKILECSESEAIEAAAPATAFIALVLGHTRRWLTTTKKDLYKDVDIIWQLNLGIPSRDYDCPTRKTFEWIARSAWWLSEQKGVLTREMVRQCLREAQQDFFEAGIHKDYINVVPEVVAQVAGYAHSPLRNEGLHVLIDVGAGTTDITSFVLHQLREEKEDVYAFMEAEVEPLGALMLHRHRRAMAERMGIELFPSMLKDTNPLFRVPDKVDGYPLYESNTAALRDVDSEFQKQVVAQLCSVMMETKKDKDPNAFAYGRKQIILFICGGGSKMDFYSKKVIDQALQQLEHVEWNGFRKIQIPFPFDLETDGLLPSDFHRIAVAYGLSNPIDNIGRILPPSRVSNIQRWRPAANSNQPIVDWQAT